MTAAHLILVWQERDDPNLLRHAERAKAVGRNPRVVAYERSFGPSASYYAWEAAGRPVHAVEVEQSRAQRRHNFGSAEPWTLGVEEELFFVDAETLEAAPGFSRVVGSGDEHVKPEVFESIVEVATGVLPDAGAVLDDLTKRRSAIAARAASHGLRVYAAGTHPLARAYDQAIVPVRRYQKMIESLGDAMRRQFVCGLHVHVSIPDPDTALRAFEWVVPWLPVLLALSANSPYAEGEDHRAPIGAGRAPPAAAHGWHSARAAQLGRLAREPPTGTSTRGRAPSTGRSRCVSSTCRRMSAARPASPRSSAPWR